MGLSKDLKDKIGIAAGACFIGGIMGFVSATIITALAFAAILIPFNDIYEKLKNR